MDTQFQLWKMKIATEVDVAMAALQYGCSKHLWPHMQNAEDTAFYVIYILPQ